MALNLSRNTKVYLTTNVNAITGAFTDATASAVAASCWEIPVLDGYSFSQNTSQQTVTLNEAGTSPVRGQRAFNTTLEAVDWSISTYVRPKLATNVLPQERILWNALMSDKSLATTAAALAVTTIPTRAATTGAGASTATVILTGVATGLIVGDSLNITNVASSTWNQPGTILSIVASTNTTCVVELAQAPAAAAGGTATGASVYAGGFGIGTSMSYASTAGSNKNTLMKFALLFVVDNQVYALDNCVVDQATIDFGLDAIATIAWTGKASALKALTNVTGAYLATAPAATPAPTDAAYITNKLSTLTLESNIGGSAGTAASVAYTVPLTGGNITIANNVSYLTPANLGVVNTAIGYFTGARAISGSINAYLRTGTAGDSGSLLSTMLTNITSSVETKYRLRIEVGGLSNSNRVEFEIGGCMLQIPQVNVADVVSTTINFNAEGYTPDVVGAVTPSFALDKANDLVVKYYAV